MPHHCSKFKMMNIFSIIVANVYHICGKLRMLHVSIPTLKRADTPKCVLLICFPICRPICGRRLE
jgi:hypothetical protein